MTGPSSQAFAGCMDVVDFLLTRLLMHAIKQTNICTAFLEALQICKARALISRISEPVDVAVLAGALIT